MHQQCRRAAGFVLKEDVTAQVLISQYPHTHPVSAKGGLYASCLIYARGCEELTFLQGNLSLSLCTAATKGQKTRCQKNNSIQGTVQLPHPQITFAVFILL